MKPVNYFFLSVLFVILVATFSSCLNPQPEASALLEKAELLMENHPESAMRVIDSIYYPEASLSKPHYMRYLIARVQARYKSYRPVAEDTLIFAARDYFVAKGKDARQTTLAYFYSGCVYREQGDVDKAMQQYKDAEQYAAKTNDVDLKGLVQYNMGDLLLEQGLHAEALEKYKRANNFYNHSPVNSEEKQARCLAAVGQMFLLLGKQDSSFVALHKGLELAESIHNRQLQSLLAQNLSVGYKEAKKYQEAEKYLTLSFILNEDTTQLTRYYLNFANLYSQTAQTDSVRLYIHKLKEGVEITDDPYLQASVYSFLADNAKANGEFDEAFDYLRKQSLLVEEITKRRLNLSVYEVQKRYDHEVVKNQYAQKLTFHQQWLISLLIILLAGGTLFTVYIIRQKNILLKTRDNIDTLRQMATDLVKLHEANLQQKESDLRELLLWKFDIVKKSALLNTGKSDNENSSQLVKKFHAIVYGGSASDQWESILSVFDQVNEKISTNLKRQFPQLNETEYRICLLAYAGMSVKESAIILQVSPNTIQSYRTGLRKKLGIKDGSTELVKFLKNRLEA